MPIPIEFTQASLIIDGRTYELRDGSAHTAERIERDELRASGGALRGFTRGRVTSRIVIEAEVMPAQTSLSTEERYERLFGVRQRTLTDQQFRDRTAEVFGLTPEVEMALIESTKPAANSPPKKPAPEPRSVWDRLIDSSEIC